MTHHEAEENYIIETITKHEPKAKDIKTETKPNGDITFLFKVGNKKHRVELLNLDYERFMTDIKKPFVIPMKAYLAEMEEATKAIREKHAEFLEEYQETLSKETKEFAIKELEKYFSL